MSALTAPRNTIEVISPMCFTRTVASGATIYAGALVAQDASCNAVPAAASSGLIVLGRAENTASDGETVTIRMGCFIYANGNGEEAIARSDIGSAAKVIDDATVGITGGDPGIFAGIILDVVDDGVVISVGPNAVSQPNIFGSSELLFEEVN